MVRNRHGANKYLFVYAPRYDDCDMNPGCQTTKVSPCLWKVVNLVRVLQGQPMLDEEGSGVDRQTKTIAGGGQKEACTPSRKPLSLPYFNDNGYSMFCSHCKRRMHEMDNGNMVAGSVSGQVARLADQGEGVIRRQVEAGRLFSILPSLLADIPQSSCTSYQRLNERQVTTTGLRQPISIATNCVVACVAEQFDRAAERKARRNEVLQTHFS